MKHIDLSKPKNKFRGLAEFMVTVEGNNFGDQILSLKQYTYKYWPDMKMHAWGYDIIAVTSRSEGDHMQLKEMQTWLTNVKKEK